MTVVPRLPSLLLYRFVILNVLLVGLVAALWTLGYVWPLYQQDSSYITYVTTALFVGGWVATARRIVYRGSLIDELKRPGAKVKDTVSRLQVKLDKACAKEAWLGDVSGWLVTLGLLGTIVGFAMVLNGINSANVTGASGVQSLIGQMVEGLRVKINTTIVGVVLAMWHEINVRVLATGTRNYFNDCILMVPR